MKPGEILSYRGTIITIESCISKADCDDNYFVKIIHIKDSKHFITYRLEPVKAGDTVRVSYNWLRIFCTPITNPKEIQAIKALFL